MNKEQFNKQVQLLFDKQKDILNRKNEKQEDGNKRQQDAVQRLRKNDRRDRPHAG